MKTTRHRGAEDARNQLPELLAAAERGRSTVITRHGKPVARLVASTGGIDRVRAQAAADRIRSRASALPPGSINWDDLKADRDEGRP